MADSVASTQQVTSTAPVTKIKNPKRVAAGKAIAEKTKLAREAQRKKLAEADVIIANSQLKKAEAAALKKAEAAAAADPPAAETATALTTTQWLSTIGIFLSVVGIYYKREEIKKLITKKPPQTRPPPSPVDVTPPPVGHKKRGGICPMD